MVVAPRDGTLNAPVLFSVEVGEDAVLIGKTSIGSVEYRVSFGAPREKRQEGRKVGIGSEGKKEDRTESNDVATRDSQRRFRGQ